jgi:hypothetical protein
MARRCLGLIGGLPTHSGNHSGREPKTEISLDLQAAHSLGDDLSAVRALRGHPTARPRTDQLTRGSQSFRTYDSRGAVPVHFDVHAEFIVQHSERQPRLRPERCQDVLLFTLAIATPFGTHVIARYNRANLLSVVGHRGGKQIRHPRRVPSLGFHGRTRAWRRPPRLRRKYNRHEQIPTPLVGHWWGSGPSPHITPISGPFPGNLDLRTYVPGPQAGDRGRGPGTCAHSPRGTPPNSRRKGAHTRYVVGWVESGYHRRGLKNTRGLCSCLVNSTGRSGQSRWGSRGR